MAEKTEKKSQDKSKAVNFTITAKQDRITKNSVRFAEEVPEGVNADAYVALIGQIYVTKHALGGAPERIRVTVEVLE